MAALLESQNKPGIQFLGAQDVTFFFFRVFYRF